MISPDALLETVLRIDFRAFYGVPDSLLQGFSSALETREGDVEHVICANEGAAIAAAVGSYVGSRRPALVYMQNSGLGNAVNPLLSIADREVYGVPMVLLVGWRGEPGKTDEPQHLKQGRVTTALLDVMEIPWLLLPDDPKHADAALRTARERAVSEGTPFVVLVQAGVIGKKPLPSEKNDKSLLTREEALREALASIPDNSITVATTGMLGRELCEIRAKHRGRTMDFLNIGGMGHASSISLGLSVAQPDKHVWCLDGDGSILMHLGSLAVMGKKAPKNFKHLIFNNGVHDSVGGQPTAIDSVSLPELGKSLGYFAVPTAFSPTEISTSVQILANYQEGPSLCEIRIRPGNRQDLGRPSETPRAMLEELMALVCPDETR